MSLPVKVSLLVILIMTVATATWFLPRDPMFACRWAWVPGMSLGILGGLYGTACGLLAGRGKARGLLTITGAVLWGIATGALLGGVVLRLAGTPYYVWYPWLAHWPGSLIFGAILLMIPLGYRAAEQARQAGEMQKLEAKDIAAR